MCRVSLFFGNTIYLVAVGYYFIVTFLGYNGEYFRPSQRSIQADRDPIALPSLHHTELLLSPIVVFGIIYIISLFGFSMPRHFASLLLLGAR